MMPVTVPSTVPGVEQVLNACFFIHLLTPVPKLSVGMASSAICWDP